MYTNQRKRNFSTKSNSTYALWQLPEGYVLFRVVYIYIIGLLLLIDINFLTLVKVKCIVKTLNFMDLLTAPYNIKYPVYLKGIMFYCTILNQSRFNVFILTKGNNISTE